MSSEPPPFPITNTFNEYAWIPSTTGLTQASANKLYLKKTTNDIATALETFNAGIATASVNSTSSSTNMTIGSNLAATQTLTLGSAGTVTVNNGTLQSQSLAPVAPASNLIIGANSTAGINIGNAGVSTTNLYGTVQAGTINSFTAGGTLNLGSNLTTGTLNLGTATSTNYIYNLESPSASTNINLYSLLSGANLTLCDGQGTGNFGIGNDSARTGGVNICTKGLGYTSNTINIGAPSNIINVGAQVNRTGLISIGSNSASTTSTGGLNLGSVSSGTGSVQLANGTSQTANIIIGNGNAVVTGSDKIIIGKSGKTVSISGATTLDNGTLNLSNGTINVNSPLTVGYATSALTSLTQIGRTVEVTFANITGIPNTGQTLFTLTIGTAGVYIINYSFRYFGASTAVANCESWFQTSTGGNIQYANQAYYSNPNALMGSNVICQAGSAVITATSTSTITFYVFITYTGGAPSLDGPYSYYSYTRLA